MNCECLTWARNSQPFTTTHHPRCPRYNPEQDAADLLRSLIAGIHAWSADEDGVHPECWDAYERAMIAIGRGTELPEGGAE